MSIENVMRPTLKGTIIDADIGAFDVILIDGWQPTGTRNRWNLTSLDSDRSVFRMVGQAGSLVEHRYSCISDLIGKACLTCCDVVMERNKRFDMVAIQPPDSMVADWPMIVWATYRETSTHRA